MLNYQKFLSDLFVDALSSIYQFDASADDVTINPTLKTFEGDYTIVLFPYVKLLKESPESIGQKVGDFLQSSNYIKSTNTIKGFLNLVMDDSFWHEALQEITETKNYGCKPSNGQRVMVEFASPNTNKPLHLGHIRNILLGWSCSKILEANGYEVVKTQIVNDRGVAVCKSMVAWQKFGQGSTPESTGQKGDHFVGEFYVLFEIKFQEEYKAWQKTETAKNIYTIKCKEKGIEDSVFFKEYKNQYFNDYSAIGEEARNMLLRWEANDKATVDLWKQMNGWVYSGFNVTYDRLNVNFDKLYFESDTYLLGKDAIAKGIEEGVFYKKDDGSVWIDLSDVGMDQKLVLRSDGTSVYITQDIGTAQLRYKDFGCKKMIYTVADEQDYHFKVLFEIMKRLGEPYASGLYHLSYGMVDLPTGRMKSREGTVVDADDIIQEVIEEATSNSLERGEIAELSPEDQTETIRKIAMAALKFFIVKVQPKVRMIYDPKESVDMQGQTGPYIQNAYVRIKSILRKNVPSQAIAGEYSNIAEEEKEILKLLIEYPKIIEDAGNKYDPSEVAKYCYSVAKEFHRFYHEVRILNAESPEAKAFRLNLCQDVAVVLNHAMRLLGIEMPEKM